jgi:hypothetical protein
LELHPAGPPDQDLAADTDAEQAAAAVRLPQRDADVGAVDRHLWERWLGAGRARLAQPLDERRVDRLGVRRPRRAGQHLLQELVGAVGDGDLGLGLGAGGGVIGVAPGGQAILRGLPMIP